MLPLPSILHGLRRLCIPALAILLVACGEDVTLEGGGAGDDDGSTPIDLTPFVGIWDITGNWNGTPDDEALLVIGELEDNESVARIFDFDDGGDNCYFRFPVAGVVEVSADNRAFLSRLPEFPNATVGLGANDATLLISFTDVNDTDGDGDNTDTRNYPPAPRFTAMMEVDLPICGASS